MSTHLSENIKLRIDLELKRALEALAESGDRTVAAEMRRALREHVRRQKEAVAP